MKKVIDSQWPISAFGTQHEAVETLTGCTAELFPLCVVIIQTLLGGILKGFYLGE